MHRPIPLLLFAITLSTVAVAQEGSWIDMNKFLYADGETTDGLGEGVAIYDNVAFLGAPAVGRANFSAGYVVVATLQDAEWTFAQELVADDGQLDDQFGFSVDVYGDLAVVGAPESSAAGDESGAAYIFVNEGGTWRQVQKIVPTGSESAENAEFGFSVAVKGNQVLVGAPGQDVNAFPVGNAYIYEMDGDQIVDEQKITYGVFATHNKVGESVDLREDLLAIGIRNQGPGSQNFGSIVLYVKENEDWVFKQELEASDADAGDFLGTSVAVSGEWLISGAPGEDQEGSNAGAAYMYQEVNGDWVEVQKLVSPMPNDQDGFGLQVAIEGTIAVVASSRNDDAANGAGTAYVFEYDGSSWQFMEQIFASDPGIGDEFGISIDIASNSGSGGHVIVAGASGENGDGDITGESIGTAYFFTNVAINVAVEDEAALRTWNLTVDDVYPNPTFGNSTLPVRVQAPAPVTIELFNVLGQRVKEIHNGTLSEGLHLLSIDTDPVAAGMHYVRITSQERTVVRAVNVLK